MKRNSRFKKWIQYNKGAAIMLGVTIGYTLIMLGIIYGLDGDLFSCASGSLSDSAKETVEIETTMNRPQS